MGDLASPVVGGRLHSRIPPRKDSVLLVARNKSAKGKGSCGPGTERNGISVGGFGGMGDLASPVVGGRRGVTNYYMCLPDQHDVDSHFRSANKGNNAAGASLKPGESSGLAVSPVALRSEQPVEVGRLQSNFIGTEFQIFLPAKTLSNPGDDVQSLDPADTSSENGLQEGDSRIYPI